MKISKKNMRHLASLSALGAGALGATAGPAEASIIYSGIIDAKVGFGPGSASEFTLAGPNGAGGVFRANYVSCGFTCSWALSWNALQAKGGANGTGFQFLAEPLYPGMILGAPANVEWGTAGGKPTASATVVIDTLSSGPGGNRRSTDFNATDRYLMFQFIGGDLSSPEYGWVQLGIAGAVKYSDLRVTVIDWAYDNSGAEIPAGDTGTPEPSTLVLTGVAALALGAKGLRSWRAARKGA
jgi:hypothetical protein